MDANDKIIQQQIEACLTLLKNVLGEDLLGVYLYGSLLMGGLQKFSDIDLFAISKRETMTEEKEQLEKALLKISGIYAVSKDRKPIELTVVVNSDISPWQYPPKFDFLYGDWFRKAFEAGQIEPWPSKILPNLALVITQLLLSNKTLFGPNPHQLLPRVPYEDFFNATTLEIANLMRDLESDTRNVLLTLARIWCTLETNTIQSKSNAATYAIERLPKEYKLVVDNARLILHGDKEENWIGLENHIEKCAEFMMDQIKKQMEIIKYSNYSERIITLG